MKGKYQIIFDSINDLFDKVGELKKSLILERKSYQRELKKNNIPFEILDDFGLSVDISELTPIGIDIVRARAKRLKEILKQLD